MKLHSIRESLRDARATLLRFPLVVLVAALGTFAALVLADYEGPPGPTILFKILLAAILGIPFLGAVALLAERYKWRRSKAVGINAIGLLVLAGYALSVPSDLAGAPGYSILRFFLFASGLHLFVATAPFLARGELNGFWQYNKSLFVRLLTALLYTIVLWAGLAIALAALKNLFGLDIPEKRYFELWILLNGLFMTWFFLAGVPRDLAHLESVTEYPKGLKVFAQYVLFPLVMVYLVILYVYMGKIIIAWDWPQGWVSKLILGFSGAGLFSLLLLHPVTGREENVWIRTAARWYYVILIPLLVMLFFAVWRRVSEYGVTPGRYLALVLGLWFAGLVIYFLASRAKNIKVIPATLCILAFVVSVGPWGMLRVSEQSQLSRFRLIAERSGFLLDGKIRPLHTEIPYRDAAQIRSILSYLHDIHGYDGLQEWFSGSLKKDSTGEGNVWKDVPAVAQMMGLGEGGGVQEWAGHAVDLQVARDGVIDLTGYDRMIRAPNITVGGGWASSTTEKISYRLGDSLHNVIIAFVREGKKVAPVEIDLRSHVERLLKEYGSANLSMIPPEKMATCSSAGETSVKVCFRKIRVEHHGGDVVATLCDADILYTIKASK